MALTKVTESVVDIDNITIENDDITGLGTVATLDTGTASGNVPVLDVNGKLNTTTLPALAITTTYSVATSAAREARVVPPLCFFAI